MTNCDGHRIAGIILAAGISSRTERLSHLMPFKGRPLLTWAVESALFSELDTVFLVLGNSQEKVRLELSSFLKHPKIEIINDPDFEQEIGSSIQCGVQAASVYHDALMFLLANQPLLDKNVINLLLQHYRQGQKTICAPRYLGKQRNPVIFHLSFREQLLSIKDDQRLDNIVWENSGQVAWRDVDHSFAFFNVDTREKLNLLQDLSSKNEYYQVAMDLISDSMVMVNRQGIIWHANDNYSKICNKPLEEIIGEPFEMVPPFLSFKEILNQRYHKGGFRTKQGNFKYSVQVAYANSWVKNEQQRGCLCKIDFSGPYTDEKKGRAPFKTAEYEGLVGESHAFRKALHIAEITSVSKSNILLQGDTGTGKEVLSNFIHKRSQLRDKPFIPINCAAIPHQLAESELFGYRSGAFSGASSQGQIGKFEMADGGTIFLDEINSLEKSIQSKLLRVIESQQLMRLGDNRIRQIKVRVIAASSANLREDVTRGTFLPELLYRINAITINIPPLCERKEDIVPLAEHFLMKYQEDSTIRLLTLSKEARQILEAYSWPGNIRELSNAIQYVLAINETGEITAEDLPLDIIESSIFVKPSRGLRRERRTKEVEIIEKAIQRASGNISNAAKQLGISRSTLYRKLGKKSLK